MKSRSVSHDGIFEKKKTSLSLSVAREPSSVGFAFQFIPIFQKVVSIVKALDLCTNMETWRSERGREEEWERERGRERERERERDKNIVPEQLANFTIGDREWNEGVRQTRDARLVGLEPFSSVLCRNTGPSFSKGNSSIRNPCRGVTLRRRGSKET